MRTHRCPTCLFEREFAPVGADRAKCSGCHAIHTTEELVAIQHDEQKSDHDLTGEEKYGGA